MGKHIVFIGAGAVGGYVGAHLARAGEDVALVDAWPGPSKRSSATACTSAARRASTS